MRDASNAQNVIKITDEQLHLVPSRSSESKTTGVVFIILTGAQLSKRIDVGAPPASLQIPLCGCPGCSKMNRDGVCSAEVNSSHEIAAQC